MHVTYLSNSDLYRATSKQAVSVAVAFERHNARGAYYAFSNVDNGYTRFDTFGELAFQCIEAQTFGYHVDTETAGIYIFDATHGHDVARTASYDDIRDTSTSVTIIAVLPLDTVDLYISEIDILDADNVVIDHVCYDYIDPLRTYASVLTDIRAFANGRPYSGHVTTRSGIALYISG